MSDSNENKPENPDTDEAFIDVNDIEVHETASSAPLDDEYAEFALEEDDVIDDSYVEDFSDFEDNHFSDQNDDFSSQEIPQPIQSEKNWFNIILFSIMGLGICGILIAYLPGILGLDLSGNNKPARQQVALTETVPVAQARSEDRQSLIEQALIAQPDDQNNDPNDLMGLLDNPDKIGSGEQSPVREDPEAVENDLFNALEEMPSIEEEPEMTIQLDSSDIPVHKMTEMPLPTPADNPGLNDADIAILVDLGNDAPRAPVAPVETAPMPPLQIDPIEQEPVLTPAVEVVEKVEDKSIENNVMIQEITAQLGVLAQRLDTMENRLNDVSVPTNDSSVNNQQMDDMRATIMALEKQIKDLNKKRVAKKTTTKRKTTTRKKVKSKEPAYKPPVTWELRGASPGQAFLAEKNSANVITIRTGDTLRGLGRIQSIAVENGRWVVRGSLAHVAQ